MTDHYIKFISRPEISFWIPIIIALLSAVLSFGVLLTRVSLLEQGQNTIIAQNEELLKSFKEQKIADELRYSNLAGRVGTNSTRLTALETLENIRHKD